MNLEFDNPVEKGVWCNNMAYLIKGFLVGFAGFLLFGCDKNPNTTDEPPRDIASDEIDHSERDVETESFDVEFDNNDSFEDADFSDIGESATTDDES